MAKMPGIPFRQANTLCPSYPRPPIGLVLHRTEGTYANFVSTVSNSNAAKNPRKVSAHFVIGKGHNEVTQLVDTDQVANHVGPTANEYFIGIEFESIADTRPANKQFGQDPATNADFLTEFQADMGWQVVEWVCRTHNIPKVGPPSARDLDACSLHWRGILGHADVSRYWDRQGRVAGDNKTDHGDELEFLGYALLGITPHA